MRGGDRPFFRALYLSEDGIDEDADPVLAAYWLAHTYNQHPSTFLDLPPDEITAHMSETIRMLQAVARARKR